MKMQLSPATIQGALTAPSSKSYAQRAIAAALLCRGTSTLTNMELCDDTAAAIEVAKHLGATIANDGSTYTIEGGFAPRQHSIDIGESGLATRLFTPIAALSHSPITVGGHGSILTRPIGMMVAPMQALGTTLQTNGFLPLTICGPLCGGHAEVDGSLSSQFLTGLLFALPLASSDTTLDVADLTSRPYIDMTLEVMRAFGVMASHDAQYSRFEIASGQQYIATEYNIEGDWSGASCLLVAGATAGSLTMSNLNLRSQQADRAILDALFDAGAVVSLRQDEITVARGPLRAFAFDATNCPDLFPALVALAASCDGVSEIVGTLRLRHKESDRATILASEFGKMGIEVDLSSTNIMRVRGGRVHGAEVDSHNDHRIAMAVATAALVADGPVTIHGAEAVSKSYPHFWSEFEKINRPQ